MAMQNLMSFPTAAVLFQQLIALTLSQIVCISLLRKRIVPKWKLGVTDEDVKSKWDLMGDNIEE